MGLSAPPSTRVGTEKGRCEGGISPRGNRRAAGCGLAFFAGCVSRRSPFSVRPLAGDEPRPRPGQVGRAVNAHSENMPTEILLVFTLLGRMPQSSAFNSYA